MLFISIPYDIQIVVKNESSLTGKTVRQIILEKLRGETVDKEFSQNRLKVPLIVITDLKDNKDVFEMSWDDLQEDYLNDYSFGYSFIRSNEPEYDFIVYAQGEGRGNYLGVMKINLENKRIEKELFYGKKIPETNYPPECYGVE